MVRTFAMKLIYHLYSQGRERHENAVPTELTRTLIILVASANAAHSLFDDRL